MLLKRADFVESYKRGAKKFWYPTLGWFGGALVGGLGGLALGLPFKGNAPGAMASIGGLAGAIAGSIYLGKKAKLGPGASALTGALGAHFLPLGAIFGPYLMGELSKPE